jgi:hypothetical protein
LIGIGVALRVGQFLANSSLWLDEAAVARNIIDRTPAGLLTPLDYAQIAPIGFLFAEKAAISVFGTSEFALRAFPLACGILSIFLFWAIVRRTLSGRAAAFALGLFVLATPLVYFSSQVKQYSSDVAAALLLLLGAIEIRCGVSVPRAVGLGLLGAALAWVSQPASFVITGVGVALLVLTVIDRNISDLKTVLAMVTIWCVGAVTAGVFLLRIVPASDREFMRWFWADGFMPMPPRTVSDGLWIFNKLTWAFGAFGSGAVRLNGGLNYRWSIVFMIVMLAGFWALFRARRDAALFVLLPILVVVGLSAAGLYPFTARLVIFLVPGFLLATAAGAEFVLSIWPERWRMLTPVALAILGGAPVYAAATATPPYWMQHVRPVLERIHASWLPGDGMYVYFGGGQAFRYYRPRLGLPVDDVLVGDCAVGNPREYLREIDRFRGRSRVWLVVTHAHYEGAEFQLILRYLDAIGRRRETIAIPGSSGRWIEGAWGYLYDLSDAERVQSVSAESIAIPMEGMPEPGPWRCYGVFVSEPKGTASGGL